MLDAVIGLGSNLGDSRRLLRDAAFAIERLGQPRGRSALYETEPIGPPQPVFLNAALRLETGLAPDALLDALLAIEKNLGRVRNERWGPRLIDLDILWTSGPPIFMPGLAVPHPELRNRAFALRPLLDVAPEACDPTDGVSYRHILGTLDASSIREISGDGAIW